MTVEEREIKIKEVFGDTQEKFENKMKSFAINVVNKAGARLKKSNIMGELNCYFPDIISKICYELARTDGKSPIDTYDESHEMKLENWIFQCSVRDVENYFRDRNAKKRVLNYTAARLNDKVYNEKEGTETELGDLLPSDFDLDYEISRNEMGERGQRFIDSLTSEIDKKIAYLIAYDYTKEEICDELGIKKREYENRLQNMKSVKNLMAANKNTEESKGERKVMVEANENVTAEKSKSEALSASQIIKMINQGSIDDNHPLQRHSEQWNLEQKSNLITTVLQGYKIPSIIFAEQILDGLPYIWNIDGKQRLGCFYSFINDQFKISKNAERTVVRYQVARKDENGNFIKGDHTPKIWDVYEFDVKGKKFSELPDILQDTISSYLIPIEKYLACTEDDIEFHIRRYNAAKTMSAAQKGITHLGRDFARVVKNLVSSSQFFDSYGSYKESERKNGTLDRMVVESVMATFFIDDWNKKQEKMCAYLKENATIAQFNTFEDYLNRLSAVSSGHEFVADLWNSKDSFIWFAAFDRFTKLCNDDEKFFEFQAWFKNEGMDIKVGNVSFNDISEKATKDKSTVIGKVNILEGLMNKFLDTDDSEDEEIIVEDNEFTVNTDDEEMLEYVDNYCNHPMFNTLGVTTDTDKKRLSIQTLALMDLGLAHLSDVKDSTLRAYVSDALIIGTEYEDIINNMDALQAVLSTTNVNKKLFAKQYIPALIVAMDYFETNEDIDEWIELFADKYEIHVGTDTMLECYEYMTEEIEKFLEYKNNSSNDDLDDLFGEENGEDIF